MIQQLHLQALVVTLIYRFTISLIEDEGAWKVENLTGLQRAFNGVYAAKYTSDTEQIDFSETIRNRVAEIYKECIQKGIIDASDLRSVDDILDNY